MSSPFVPLAAAPRHVGIIMDGNGRWAEQRRLPREAGHHAGAKAVRRITEAAGRAGLKQLTLYAFSSENWSRPAREVTALMGLFARHLRSERPRLLRHGIRLRAIGRTAELPLRVQEELARTVRETACNAGITLCLAVNYGARDEIMDACRGLAADLAAGRLDADRMGDRDLTARLYQPDMPPLDLVIRTGGEMRLSNFLLWQAAYAELWMTPVLWPDFGAQHLEQALADFGRRTRRFGSLPVEPPAERSTAVPVPA